MGELLVHHSGSADATVQYGLGHDHGDRWRLRAGENLLAFQPASQQHVWRLGFARLCRQDRMSVGLDLEYAGDQDGSPIEQRGGVLLSLHPVHEELGERSPVLPDMLCPLLDQPVVDQRVELRELVGVSPSYVW